MTEKIIIAGAGGQGIMLLGKILAEAVMQEDKLVTWFPSYGAEVRGGTAHCMVVVSDKEISSPYIDKADTLIVMNRPSLDKFKNRINNKGLLIINTSMAEPDAERSYLVKHPFSDIALRLGNIKTANMVALGCYIKHKKIVKKDTVMQVMKEMAPKDKKWLLEINNKALEEGMNLR